jgi:hypothetical protein
MELQHLVEAGKTVGNGVLAVSLNGWPSFLRHVAGNPRQTTYLLSQLAFYLQDDGRGDPVGRRREGRLGLRSVAYVGRDNLRSGKR